MESKQTKMRGRSLARVIFLLCLALLCIGVGSFTLARYFVESDTGSQAQVATFHAEYSSGTQSIAFSLEGMKPGDTRTVTLSVQNDSSVDIAYSLQAQVAGAIPLEISFSTHTGTLTSGDGAAPHTMTVVWPAAQKDAALAAEIGAVTVMLQYEQLA